MPKIRHTKKLITAFLPLFIVSTNIFAANLGQSPSIVVKKNEQTGNYQVPDDFAGSASYVSNEDVSNKQTLDINRLIRDVPGVNISEEDGYGLRPNIGIRGGRSDRSADITLMEDGILIAPAPYSASAAYYFPSTGRIKGIEVRKGSSSIKYGPRTTSGAVNLLTTPIPDFSKGTFIGSIGDNEEKNVNMNYGNSYKNFGYLINVDRQTSNGFKKLDDGGNTGYKLHDFMTKLRFNSNPNAKIYQAVELKVAYNDEDSNETYVGLTLEDFVANPYRRYKGSALDNMDAQHEQYELKHFIKPTKNIDVTTTAYYHKFKRNWYKLSKVDDLATIGNKSITDIFADTTKYASNLSVIKGMSDGELNVKANNRQYVSQGVQSIANNSFKIKNSQHNLEYGIRYHSDYEDRLQHTDTYSMTNGNIAFSSAGPVGDKGNRIDSTRALSGFIDNEIKLGKLTINPGIRFEHIELKRKKYAGGSSDVGRNDATTTKNSEDVFIPGIAANYSFGDNLNIFAGVHKGFSPPSPGTLADSEESVNYEAGLRFRKDKLFFESVLFFNNYDNLLGEDTASSAGGGSGDQYNGGAVDSYGLELATNYKASANLFGKEVKLPLRASYTYNDAEFKSSFNEDGIDEWGDVTKGYKLPYIANHQFSFGIGADFNKFSLNLSNKFVSSMRQSASSGSIAKDEKIPSHFITDFVGFYELKKDQSLFIAIDNILDKKYAVSLRPAGMRPGKPMTLRVGLKIDF